MDWLLNKRTLIPHPNDAALSRKLFLQSTDPTFQKYFQLELLLSVVLSSAPQPCYV